MKKAAAKLLAISSASVAALAVHAPVMAQSSSAQMVSPGDIIVTARKREETALEVPVAITAIGQEQLQNFGITTVDAVARAVPSLIIGEGGGTVQGGIISIRGLAGADNNPLNDQAVSFNIDGISIGRATVRRMSELDLAHIEVLKGPQALFFGKNSPAGIISIRTADPTDKFEAGIKAGYEFNAREIRTEAYVSGPINDMIGYRIAGFYSDMSGWAKNEVPRDFANTSTAQIFPLDSHRAPDKKDFAIRGTLTFDNADNFDARLKLTYGKVIDQTSSAGNTQFVACPLGAPQFSIGMPANLPVDNCVADNKNLVGGFNGANVENLFPEMDWNGGQPRLEQYQFLGGLEMNYQVDEDVKLTSVTGFYKQKLDNIANFTQYYYEDGAVYFLNGAGNPAPAGQGAQVRRWHLPSYNELALREFSQELRLASDFTGPINFMMGGLFTDSKATAGSTTPARTTNPVALNKYKYVQEGQSYSIFGQIIAKPIEIIELSAGARASWEKKRLPTLLNYDPTAPGNLSPITAAGLRRKVDFFDVSPEFTAALHPSRDLNIYASYKEGFLSGGFSALTPTAGVIGGTQQVTYDQQVTKGIEAGIKAALFDRTLQVNLAAYNYKTTGLQVGVTVSGVQQELRNAGSVRTKGIEADFTYRTPLDGLSLNGAMNYNKAYYIDYQASCYRGQPSEECFVQFNNFTGTSALLQNLSGQELVRAPRWTANAGFNFDRPINEGMKIGLSGNMSYSDSYFTDTTNTPGGRQPSYTLFDASLRLSQAQDRWEIALIGRNLTDKYYFVRSSDTPFTGSDPGRYARNDPLRLLGDTAAYVGRGREIWVRLSYRFGR
ncbi:MULTISPECIES: TonB-dependent receptor [Sphingobium]|uniref:TonB-dependent receptor n=1 Tax=Sphingobium sp. MI1205 TaxID=407020 RepID=UPI0007702447|nr:TonB-dependent receptor [Sphingobium sp. MI1205]AMK16574.1 TonB-dependent receptor [Sphingobium sp. MI1205]